MGPDSSITPTFLRGRGIRRPRPESRSGCIALMSPAPTQDSLPGHGGRRPAPGFAVEARHPEWITSAPGIATVPAPGVAYVGQFAAGHGVPLLVVGPANGSRLTCAGG
jgi:hypothetical protein